MMRSSKSVAVACVFGLVVACAAVAGCDQANANQDSGAAVSSTPADAKSSTSASTPPFHGPFWADVNGQRIILRLEQAGASVSGNVDGATLSGRADGDSARGEVRDPQSPQVEATFEMKRAGANLAFTLKLRDPQTAQSVDVPTISLARGEPPRVDAKLDSRAVGRWRHTWAQASGGFSVAIDYWMTLGADGTFTYGDSKMAGGGPDSSFVGDRGDVERGHWRAEAGALHVSQDNGATWHRYAKYAIDGDTMMLTYDNGKRQIWERQ